MDTLRIENYKNFKRFELDNLGRVNLFVGRNNTGKSSVLEALSILAAEGDVAWLKVILEQRGMYFDNRKPRTGWDYRINEDIFSSFFHNYDLSAPITIAGFRRTEGSAADGTSTSGVRIRRVELADLIFKSNTGEELIRRVIKEKENQPETEEVATTGGVTVETPSTRQTYGFDVMGLIPVEKKSSSISFEYVRTSEFSGDRNPGLFDKIALSELEDELIKALHIIDRDIQAINFLKDESRVLTLKGDPRVPYVVLRNKSGKIRLSSMGDGINRILTIILSALNVKDGILLIDEFENGLHYTVQEELWRIIYKLSERLNFQVFATTHSNDCLRSFLKATSGVSDTRLIRLEKYSEGIRGVVYSDADELEYIASSNIETR